MNRTLSSHWPLLVILVAAATTTCATTAAKPTPIQLNSEERSCMNDVDCQITDAGAGCCTCKAEPYAINKQALAKKMDLCSVVECTCEAGTDCTCPKVGDPAKYRAVCTEGECRRKAD